jgi:dTDP-4-amino-4,6-dideoxygalactose transaminase
MPTASSVAEQLCGVFDREHCTFVGRGTTGLTLAFEALDVSRALFPAYTCPSVAYAGLYADVEPVFADVAPDYTLDPAAVDEVASDVDAVVPIHMFGHPARVPEIRRLCGSDVAVVEDACQSVGSSYESEVVGSMGDVSVVSFQHKKPIDAGRGGAVLTDDPDLAARLDRLADDLPAVDGDRLDALGDHYRSLYRETTALVEACDVGERLFRDLPDVFEELYVHRFDDGRLDALAAALDGLPDTIETRRTHAATYCDRIDHPSITHPDPAGDTVYYRYSLRLPDRETRDFVVSYLRDRNFHVSTLYDPITRHIKLEADFPTAKRLSRRTLNLWVAPRVDGQYVRECADTFLAALDAYEAH